MITHCAHSADVTIGLLINGNWLPVAQLGPDFLLLYVAADHPPCDAVKLCVSRLRKAGNSRRRWCEVRPLTIRINFAIRIADRPHSASGRGPASLRCPTLPHLLLWTPHSRFLSSEPLPDPRALFSVRRRSRELSHLRSDKLSHWVAASSGTGWFCRPNALARKRFAAAAWPRGESRGSHPRPRNRSLRVRFFLGDALDGFRKPPVRCR